MIEQHLPTMGLCLEILGLLFLFYDLIMSKNADQYEISFQSAQDGVDEEVRRLIIRLNSALRMHSNFVSKYLSLEYGGIYNQLQPGNQDNVSILERIRVKALTDFKNANDSIIHEKDLEDILNQIESLRLVTMGHYIRQVKANKRLRTVATLGIIFVGIGAITQLAAILIQSGANA